MKYIVGFLFSILIGYLALLQLPDLGTRPTQIDYKKFVKSRNFDSNKKVFINRRSEIFEIMHKRGINFQLIEEWIFAPNNQGFPDQKLPDIKPNFDEFLNPSKDIKVIWFGHSTFLLNMDGVITLVDPVFSNAASPFSFIAPRFQKVVAELTELPKIDYIVISHDHYDHLDMKTMKFFKNKNVKFLVPLGVGMHLKYWGIDSNKIIEKDWWQSEKFSNIEFIATPSQHFSGRDLIHENETLWSSWVIRTKNHNIYFSGDTGYDTHFKKIGEKFGPFDIAFMETGQYDERWKEVHLLPHQCVKAFQDINAKKYFPVHWGMFELSLHSWFDPIEELYKYSQALNFELMAPMIGETITTGAPTPVYQWWRMKNKISELMIRSLNL